MRPFNGTLSGDCLRGLQTGVMRYKYRGVPCLKSPIDLAVYLSLLWDLRPSLLVEIGSKKGGSALFFADAIATFGFDCRIISVDLKPPALADARVEFIEGDVADLATAMEQVGALQAPHPWLVVEDSSHQYEDSLAALRYFASTMARGDVLVIEDGIVDQLGLSEHYGGGPNRAIEDFFEGSPETFEVMTDLCDMFGPNATYNPNGYLRRR